MTTIEQRNANLDAAKALVLKGWCQRKYATKSNGYPVSPLEAYAVCFCARGAILRVTNTPSDDGTEMTLPEMTALDAASLHVSGDSVVTYNDAPGRTKYEVAAMFDHAKLEPL